MLGVGRPARNLKVAVDQDFWDWGGQKMKDYCAAIFVVDVRDGLLLGLAHDERGIHSDTGRNFVGCSAFRRPAPSRIAQGRHGGCGPFLLKEPFPSGQEAHRDRKTVGFFVS